MRSLLRIHSLTLGLLGAALAAQAQPYPAGPLTSPYPKRIHDGALIQMVGYHQQKDWTCGPASILMVEKYYFPNSPLTEAAIESPALTTEEMGTSLEGMRAYYAQAGWTLLVKENATTDDLLRAIRKGIPTIVGWCDWGGHWAVPVGYDLRRGKDVYWQDDQIIFRDPYDQTDDVVDAYSDFSLWRFNDMWEEYNYITPGRKNYHLLLVPVPKNPQAHRDEARAARRLFESAD